MALDITTLEKWLWEAACTIRGPLDAPSRQVLTALEAWQDGA